MLDLVLTKKMFQNMIQPIQQWKWVISQFSCWIVLGCFRSHHQRNRNFTGLNIQTWWFEDIWRGCFGLSEIKNYRGNMWEPPLLCPLFSNLFLGESHDNLSYLRDDCTDTWDLSCMERLALDSNGFNLWKTRHGAWKLRERTMKLIWYMEVSNPWVTQIIQSSWMTMFDSEDFSSEYLLDINDQPLKILWPNWMVKNKKNQPWVPGSSIFWAKIPSTRPFTFMYTVLDSRGP